MEALGTISGGEWNPINGMCSEEADFMPQLLGNFSLPNEVPSSFNFAFSSALWPDHATNLSLFGVNESALYSSDGANTGVNSFSRGSSYSGGNSIFFSSLSHESYYPCVSHQISMTNSNLMAMDFCMIDGKNNSYQIPLHTDNTTEGDDFLNLDANYESMESDKKQPEDVCQRKNIQLGRGHETPIPEPLKEDKSTCPSDISKKRPQVPGKFERSKRSMKSKKGAKVDGNDEDNNANLVLRGQSLSSCCSEDDSDASHELNGATSSSSSKGSKALKLNGKTRVRRGSATDPQSLYARKRRVRINERLRIFPNLVPNGTKVDVSTMPEEAVQYIKFLQLQIKLLSSDDLWLYAPIAYNGMDIGLDLKIPTPKSQS